MLKLTIPVVKEQTNLVDETRARIKMTKYDFIEHRNDSLLSLISINVWDCLGKKKALKGW